LKISSRNKFLLGFTSLTIFGLSLFTVVVYDRSVEFKNREEIKVYRKIADQVRDHVFYSHNIKLHDIQIEYAEFSHSMKTAGEMSFFVGDSGKIIFGSSDLEEKESFFLQHIKNSAGNEGQVYYQEQNFLWLKSPIPEYNGNLILIYPLSSSAISEFYDVFGMPLIITSIVILWVVFWAAIIISSMMMKLNQQRIILSEQAEDIKNARDEALQTSRFKSSFLANMSHEIRTPLTSIIGFAESILDSDQSMHERLNSINTIIRSGKHLLNVINEILDLSKIEAGKLEIEKMPTSIFEVMDEVNDFVSMQVKEKNLTFGINYKFPIPKTIITDPLRLKQILLNLCSNAVKFTNQGYVYLNVSYKTETNQVSFEVVDTGIGLTEEQISKIFLPFKQADNSITRQFGGTGLGLSLSREMVDLLNGELLVHSVPGKGSSFTVLLQDAEISNDDFIYQQEERKSKITTDVAIETNVAKQFTGNILIVDDNEDIRNLVKMLLNKLGCETDYAENGLIGIEKAIENDYDLVLMDMQMPVMDGLTAIEKLREQGYKRPIVVMTANAMKSDRDKCMKAGSDDFLTKPINREHLYNTVARYLSENKSALVVENPAVITSTLLETEPEMIELVEKFINKLPEFITEINVALDEANWIKLSGLAHQLKGSGGGYGYQCITNLCAKIEFQLASEDYSKVKELISELNNMRDAIVAGKDKNIQVAEIKKAALK